MKRFSAAGFTLVEVAMVTLLLAMMAGILYGSLRSIVRTKTQIESQRAVMRTAEYVISRITRELTNRLDQPLATAEAAAPKVSLRGKNRRENDVDSDLIRFVSLGAGQVLYEGLTNFGAVEVEYRLEEAGEGEQITSGPSGKRLVLVREEVPAVDNKDIREKRRIVFPLSENVAELNFRYRHNGRWLDEWSEKRQTLPDAVEVTIGVPTASGAVERFRTAVSLFRAEQ